MSVLSISNKICQCRSTDYKADGTVWDNSPSAVGIDPVIAMKT